MKYKISGVETKMTKWEKSLLCRPSEWKEERKKYLPTLRKVRLDWIGRHEWMRCRQARLSSMELGRVPSLPSPFTPSLLIPSHPIQHPPQPKLSPPRAPFGNNIIHLPIFVIHPCLSITVLTNPIKRAVQGLYVIVSSKPHITIVALYSTRTSYLSCGLELCPSLYKRSQSLCLSPTNKSYMLRQLQLPLLLADPALPKSFEFVETQYRTDTGTHTSTWSSTLLVLHSLLHMSIHVCLCSKSFS